MALTNAALLSELQTDPTARGYAPFIASGNDGKLAELLNEVQAGISVFRGAVPTWELLASTDVAELNGLAAPAQRLYGFMVSAGVIDISDANIRTLLASMFAAGSVTRTAFLARISRQGSRAEQLGGAGMGVTDTQVAKALRG